MIGLTIAGFDPSGGAGILEDVKTMASFGLHPCAVVTSLTAQNPKKVFSVEPVRAEYISKQIDSIFDDYDVKYAKTGLLYSKEIIQLISRKVDEYDLKIVVDPVMVASAGDSLAKEKTADSMKKYLLEKSLLKYLLDKSILVTPNVSEAEKLSNMKIETEEDAVEAAFKIGKYCSVIITGGHLNGTNIIYNKQKDELTTIHQDLIESDNVHGTGCSFSAAVTANLVRLDKNQKIADDSNQNNLELAIQNSLKFVYESVKNGRYGTLNPNFNSKPFII